MPFRTEWPRLLIYSQDGLGLGHLRRTTLLATQYLDSHAGAASVLTICDSPLGQFFTPSKGHDHLKLPSVRKIRPGEWAPVSLSVSFADVVEMRRDLIRAAAVNFEPDVLLVDHMPHGAMGELLPTLEALSASPMRTVLGLRDILDAPETVRRRWQLEGALEAVERYFDDVLVYGSRDVFDVAASYGWPPSVTEKLRYCGYVCSPSPVLPATPLRRRLEGAPDGKIIVAMAGGGADASVLFETLLQAVPDVTARHRCFFLLVTGPFLPEADYARLERLAEGRPVQLTRTVANSLDFLAAADLVVAMAGYNTTAEILKVRTPALLVPRAGPSAEQSMRARLLAQRGWVSWLPPDSLSVPHMATAVLSALEQTRPRWVDGPDLSGLQRATWHLQARPANGNTALGGRAVMFPDAPVAGSPARLSDEV